MDAWHNSSNVIINDPIFLWELARAFFFSPIGQNAASNNFAQKLI